MKKIIVLLTVITVFSITGLADVPPIKPTPAPTPKVKDNAARRTMQIIVNPNVNETTLTLPKSLVKNLRAALDEADNQDQNTAAATTGFNVTPTQTLMGGLFMSLAILIGGIWVFRAKPLGTTVKIVGGLIMAAMFGASATIIFANVAPPPYKGIDQSIFSDKMQNHWNGTVGEVKVVIDDEKGPRGDGQIILLVPRRSQ